MEKLSNKRVLVGVLQGLLALMLVLLFISGAVFAVLAFRPLYYFDVDYFDVVKQSGYSKEEIIENYDALIDYNLPLTDGDLVFPTLPMSEHGKQHFAEVKDIFDIFKILFLILLPLCIAGIVLLTMLKRRTYLLATGILSFGLPALVGSLIALNWETVFVKFHELFFNNDYWLFNPKTDPVITILPDGFFMHCAIGIILLVLLSGGICFGVWLGKRMKEKRLQSLN